LNDLTEIFKNASGSVNVNNNRVDCLMYADDIVIFSETQEGLQERMDLLHTYCSNWCLSVNLSKTNVVIFNKAGKCLKHPIYFNGTLIRSASLYR
jgi:hypothetical protein